MCASVVVMSAVDLDARQDLTFEQAEGAEPLPSQLQLGEISQELRAKLWNVLYSSLPKVAVTYSGYHLAEPWRQILQDLHVHREHGMVDDFSDLFDRQVKQLRSTLEHGNYVSVLGLIQWLMRHPHCPKDFPKRIDLALRSGRAAYRVMAGTTIAPIASEADERTLKRAYADLKGSEFGGARAHLRDAAEGAAVGNWAASIRESVHAVESVARMLAPSGELSTALSTLEQTASIHGALKKGFTAIYGFTSDEKGIRHPLLDDPAANVDEADALFMLGACAAFVSYLISKGRKAGLLTT